MNTPLLPQASRTAPGAEPSPFRDESRPWGALFFLGMATLAAPNVARIYREGLHLQPRAVSAPALPKLDTYEVQQNVAEPGAGAHHAPVPPQNK